MDFLSASKDRFFF